MNINTLYYFISAAELCSFTKAAKEHFVAQTAISQQIAKIEQELGMPLFIREKKRVILTNEGQVFYKEIKKVLLDYENAIQKTKRCYEDQKKVLTIGYSRQMDIELLTNTIVEYQNENPDVEIIIKEDSMSHLIQEVKHGVCDIVLNMSITFPVSEEANLLKYTFYQGDMLLAVSTKHPKAQQEAVEATELKEEKFVVLNAGGEELGFMEMHSHCKSDGYELNIIDYAPNFGALLFQVELNRGVAFVNDQMKNPSPEHIKFLRINNSAHKYGVDIIWNKLNDDTTLKAFIAFIKKHHKKNLS